MKGNPQWLEGKSGNPNGRPKGSSNAVTTQIREAFAQLLELKLPELNSWLDRVAEDDPEKALQIIIKISERFVPSLARTELTGGNGEPLKIEFTFGTKPIQDEDIRE